MLGPRSTWRPAQAPPTFHKQRRHEPTWPPASACGYTTSRGLQRLPLIQEHHCNPLRGLAHVPQARTHSARSDPCKSHSHSVAPLAFIHRRASPLDGRMVVAPLLPCTYVYMNTYILDTYIYMYPICEFCSFPTTCLSLCYVLRYYNA